MVRMRMRSVVAPAVVSCATLISVAACFPDPTNNDQLPGFDAGGISLDGSKLDGSEGVDATTKCTETLCNLICVDIGTDIRNCGGCGHDCTKLPGVIASSVTCVSGACDFDRACAPGKAHCGSNQNTGCDTDVDTVSQCGSCTTSCAEPTPFCSEDALDGGVDDAGDAGTSGIYACASGCSGLTPTRCDAMCVDTTSNVDYCSGCMSPCPAVANGTRTCVASMCGFNCDSGFTPSGSSCLPTIDITAPSPFATDGGGTTATFHVSRGTVTTGDFVVTLTVDASSTVTTTSTGVIPVDYALSGGSVSQVGANITVTIPDGQTGVDITMTPTANTHAEAAEILALDVASDASYIVGGGASAIATIAAHGLGVVVDTDSLSSYALQEGGIRQALTNAEAFAGGTIVVDNAAAGTVDLAGSLPLIDQNVSITGPSGLLTLNGNGTFRIIEMRGTGAWSFLGFTNGFDSAIGGAILDRGDLTLDHVLLDSNSSPAGEAIAVGTTGSPNLTLTTCTVTNNTGGDAAIHVAPGTLTITGSTFSGNGNNVVGAYTNGGGNTPTNP